MVPFRNGHQAALSALKAKVELPLTAVGYVFFLLCTDASEFTLLFFRDAVLVPRALVSISTTCR